MPRRPGFRPTSRSSARPTTQLSEETRSREPAIPSRAIAGMRNRIVHAYWDIDADIVWKTAVEEIPALLPQLRDLLARAGGEKGKDV
ncbi:MAG TPA: DUF86 domain-containing protein [Candidatus Binatia bacterium]|nr:DUF86 domain-containing protein [Candidatus Binatia bacterium]